MFDWLLGKTKLVKPAWQQKLDDIEQRDLLALRQRCEAESLEYSKREETDRQEKLKQLGKLFKCHICEKPAMVAFLHQWETDGGGMNGPSFHSGLDWSKPGDLTKCSVCLEWTCSKHIYKGICQKCIEKM